MREVRRKRRSRTARCARSGQSPAAFAGARCRGLPHPIEGFNCGTAEPALSLARKPLPTRGLRDRGNEGLPAVTVRRQSGTGSAQEGQGAGPVLRLVAILLVSSVPVRGVRAQRGEFRRRRNLKNQGVRYEPRETEAIASAHSSPAVSNRGSASAVSSMSRSVVASVGFSTLSKFACSSS